MSNILNLDMTSDKSYKQVFIEKNFGPGPQSIIQGDMYQGFYGETLQTNLIDGPSLQNMVNLNIGIPQNDNIEWLKFAINNKIIYTPKKPIRYNLSWSDLYNLNLIDGSKLLVINGDEYYIRLFKGQNTNPFNSSSDDKNQILSEWNKLMLPIHEDQPNNFTYPQFVGTDVPDWNINYTDEDLLLSHEYGYGYHTLTQEETISDSNRKMTRGYYGPESVSDKHKDEVQVSIGWRPVLELVNIKPENNIFTINTNIIGNGDISINPIKNEYVQNEEVIITQIPNETYEFLNWSGDLNGNELQKTINIQQDLDITQNFSTEYSIERNISIDKQRHLKAIYKLKDSEYDSTSNLISGTVTCTKTYTAYFEKLIYQLSYSVNDSNMGSILGSPKQSYEYNTSINIIQQQKSGYKFVKWVNPDGTLYSEEQNLSFNISEDIELKAIFEKELYQLQMYTQGLGSYSVTPIKDGYEYNEQITIEQQETNGNYQFKEWNINGLIISDSSYTFNIQEDMEIGQIFEQQKYTLDITVIGNGTYSINPDKPEYDYNEEVTITQNPDDGWKVLNWDDNENEINNTYTITMDSNKNIILNLEQIKYELNVYNIGDGNGSIELNPDKEFYYYNDSVSITQIPGDHSTFGGMSGDIISNQYTENITITKDTTIDIDFIQDKYTLTQVINGNGQIDKNPNKQEYMYNDSIQLTQAPDNGWKFVSWENGSTNPGRVINIINDIEIIQNFEKIEYSITLSSYGNGTVDKVPNNIIYYYNDEVTLNAYPENGYEFDSWIGDIETQTNPYTFNITDDIIVSGKFAQEFYNITKIINGEGNVSIGPNKNQYAYNDEVTLYASPKVGYEFSHWGTNTSDNNPTKSIIITDDITITANFIPKVLSLNINNDSSKGIVNITPNDTEFNYGTNINIQITPNDGYIFDKVYGDYNTSELNFSFDIFEDMELTISYSSKQYRINSSVSPAGSGSIKLNKDNNIYNYNENQIIEQIPEDGYEFDSWSGDLSGNINPYSTNITHDITLQQNFIIQQYTLTLSSNINGGILSGQGTYEYNTGINIFIDINDGYTFNHWEDINGNIISNKMNFYYSMPNKDAELIAIFDTSKFRVSSTVMPYNSGKIYGNGLYEYNQEVTLNAIQNNGYTFKEWRETNTNTIVSNNNKYIFNMPQKDTNYLAMFDKQNYELLLEQNPTEQATTNGAGMYEYDEYVYIGISPNDEYKFLYWKDINGNVISNIPNYNFRMPNKNTKYIAYFEKYDRILNLESNIYSDSNINGQGNYKTGDLINISQDIPEGYKFLHWKDKNTNQIISEDINFQYTMPNSNKTLIAIYEALGIELIVDSNIPEASELFGNGVYKLNDIVLVYYDLNKGYKFIKWVDENNNLLSEEQYFNYTIKDEYNYVKAIFEEIDYTLDIDIIGNGQVIKNPDKQYYTYNETVELIQTPNDGYEFENWSGDIAGFRNPMYINMLDSLNIEQSFTQKSYSIFRNIEGNGNGFISITPNQYFFNHGTTVNIKAVPDGESVFKEWKEDITSNNQEEVFKIYDDTYLTQVFELQLKGDLEIEYPVDKQDELPLEVNVQWNLYNQNQDISNIDYEIYLDNIYQQITKDKNYTLENLTFNQEYQVMVKQIHENGELESKIIRFKTKNQPKPKTFEVTSPLNNMIQINDTINITWEPALMPYYLDTKNDTIEINNIKDNKHFIITLEEEDKGDIWYRIYIDQKDEPDTFIQERFNDTYFNYDISNLDFGVYNIRIKAINAIGEEIYSSNIGSFMKYLNEDIYINNPSELSIIPKSNQLLQWTDHNTESGYYNLYIIKDNKEDLELSTTMMDQTYTTNNNEYLQDIDISGKYYMRVIKYNNSDIPIQMSPIRAYYLVTMSKPVMYSIPEKICRPNETLYIDLNEYIKDNHNLSLDINIKDNDGLNLYLNENNILQYQWDINDNGIHTITIEAENTAKLQNEMTFNINTLVPPTINKSYFN